MQEAAGATRQYPEKHRRPGGLYVIIPNEKGNKGDPRQIPAKVSAKKTAYSRPK